MNPIPSPLDPRWRDLVTGKVAPRWQNLAVKLMMKRVLDATTADPKPMNVAKCVNEVHSYFVKNSAAAAADLSAIFH